MMENRSTKNQDAKLMTSPTQKQPQIGEQKRGGVEKSKGKNRGSHTRIWSQVQNSHPSRLKGKKGLSDLRF